MSLREFRATSNRVLRTEHGPRFGASSSHRRDLTQRSVVMIGLFGVGNFGNEASLAAALGAARRVLPTAHLTTICPNPARVEREHGVSGVSINPSSRWARFAEGSRLRRLATAPLRELARSGICCATSAPRRSDGRSRNGILDDFGMGPSHVPLQILRWSVAARMTGTRLVFLSIGAGPIVHRVSRLLMRASVAQADFCSYRDEGSRRFMASIGRQTADDEVWPDLVFALERGTAEPRIDAPFTVALGVMNYRGWRGWGSGDGAGLGDGTGLGEGMGVGIGVGVGLGCILLETEPHPARNSKSPVRVLKDSTHADLLGIVAFIQKGNLFDS